MTGADVTTLLGFLTGGLLVGLVGHWFDLVALIVRRG